MLTDKKMPSLKDKYYGHAESVKKTYHRRKKVEDEPVKEKKKNEKK